MKHAPAFLALVNEVMPRIREIASDDVRKWLDNQMVFRLVDVREDYEWSKGHIKGALHLGRGIIERDIESAVPDKNETLVLYCGGGFRSALVADSLQKMGYTQVLSMSGGWREWTEKQFPVE